MPHSLFESYFMRQRRRDAGPAALTNAAHYLGKLDDWMTEHGIDPLTATADDLEDFKAHLRKLYSPSTVKLAVTQVRAAYRNAHRQGIIARDPGADLLAPKLPEIEPKTFTAAELRQILATVPTRRHDALVRLMAFGGLRRVEVRRLTWPDVEVRTATMNVMGKGNKLRKVPMHPAVAESLHALRLVRIGQSVQSEPFTEYVLGTAEWGQLSNDAFGRMIDGLSGCSGIKIESHSFRKTLASDLYERGVAENVIESIFGWSKSTVRARHYTRIAGEQMQRAILMAYKDLKVLPPERRTALIAI